MILPGGYKKIYYFILSEILLRKWCKMEFYQILRRCSVFPREAKYCGYTQIFQCCECE